MPLPVESLTPDSSITQIRQAISESIKTCMHEPPPEGAESQQKYCAGQAYGIARDKTGKELGEGRQ